MTMPGGLLDQSAIQRLLASMQGGTQNAVQAPNLGGLMAPQIQPTPPFNPGRSTPAGGDPTHGHRSGIRGSILHAVGADKVAPELASLLTPDQQARVQPGLMATIGNAVIRGKTPAQVQQERAENILDLQDKKRLRVKRDRDEAIWEQIQGVAAQIPDPQARLEYTARMASSMGLAQGPQTAEAADRLRPPQMQLRANAKMTVLGNDGNYYAIQQDPMGNEVPGSRVRVPKPTSGITYKEGVGPDGAPVIYALPSEESGDSRGPVAPRATGIAVPVEDKSDPQTIRVINAERSLAADDARQSWEGLIDENGKMKDPPGHLDRVFTRSEQTNWMASENGQAYMNNVRKLIRSWVVLIEGKRMSDADARVNELQRSFSFGDKGVVVEGKKQTLESMKRSIDNLMRSQAQPSAGQAAPRTFTLRNGQVITLPPDGE